MCSGMDPCAKVVLTASQRLTTMPRMKIEDTQLEYEGLLDVARLMCVAARTAPKGRGVDRLVVAVLTGDEKNKLADEMQRIGEQTAAEFFIRDAKNVRVAGAVVLLGTKLSTLGIPACGYCGSENCAANEKKGGICVFNIADLGIALGSAVSVAANHRVDCRIFFSAGRAALNQKHLGEDVKIAYGIPISVGPKSPFFDR
jgi:uncharacterized ferredoxin-like protein